MDNSLQMTLYSSLSRRGRPAAPLLQAFFNPGGRTSPSICWGNDAAVSVLRVQQRVLQLSVASSGFATSVPHHHHRHPHQGHTTQAGSHGDAGSGTGRHGAVIVSGSRVVDGVFSSRRRAQHHHLGLLVPLPCVCLRVKDDHVVGGWCRQRRDRDEGRSFDRRQHGAGQRPCPHAVVDLTALVHRGQVAAEAIGAAHRPFICLLLEERLQLHRWPGSRSFWFDQVLVRVVACHGQGVACCATDEACEGNGVRLAKLKVIAETHVQVCIHADVEREEWRGAGRSASDGVVDPGGVEAAKQIPRVRRHTAGSNTPVHVVGSCALVIVIMAPVPE